MAALVVDASAAISAALSRSGFETLRGFGLSAPPLMWSEALSALHEMRWRDQISGALARAARERLQSAPIERALPAELYEEAWSVAEELGWAKTYDAEYIALARLLNCRLLTLDQRLQRGARDLVAVVGPADL